LHTRCHVHNKVCSLIIDGSSCINIASTKLMRKLNLCTTKYLILYELQWLNDGGKLKVNQQVLVVFLLLNIVMRVYEMLCQCKLVTYFLVDHGSIIGEISMMK